MRRRKRSKSFQIIQFVLIILAGLCGVAAGSGVETIPLKLFDMGRGCSLLPESTNGVQLRMNEHYIGGPREGEDWGLWLAAMRDYRQRVREGKVCYRIQINFDGTYSWVRLGLPITKAYEFRGGDKLKVEIDARWLEGNNELCIAFDVHSKSGDAKTGWSGVVGTIAIEKDGRWHKVKTEVDVPKFDSAEQIYRPIFGMDAKHDAARGRLEIRSIDLRVGDGGRMAAAEGAIEQRTKQYGPLDRSLYERENLSWAREMFTCHFTFMYDSSFYDVENGEYRLESFLDEGVREFGGYDAIMLWQAYPRLGVDERNQFDMLGEMPGGFPGILELVEKAHKRGVKVLVNYNPWDVSTRQGKLSDIDVEFFTFHKADGPEEYKTVRIGTGHTFLPEELLEEVAATGTDGIFLDTMLKGSFELRRAVDGVRGGAILMPEAHPPIEQISICSASWAQGLSYGYRPGVLHLKWIEPRHIQNQIRRWELSHQAEIEAAFFNGSGMIIWENIFGTYNPWRIEDRLTWRRAVSILRHFKGNFSSEAWEPFYPTMRRGLFANCWPGEGATVFTLVNHGKAIKDGGLLEAAFRDGTVYFDLWNGRRLRSEKAGQRVRVFGSIDRLGCIVAVDENKVDKCFRELLVKQQEQAGEEIPRDDLRNFAKSVVHPEAAGRTKLRGSDEAPDGMVFVPRTLFDMKVEHVRRECGCYPDPQTPYEERRLDFLWGEPFYGKITHDIGPVEVGPFFIDETEVSNADFKRFLDDTGYRPREAKNFLKHWPNGEMPDELADHPVVYIDIDDARAYARWAGKRLPTEYEWQLAAQGTDGRKWPWGNKFDESKCNTTGDRTMPVKSYPGGRSPYGCYNMAGNVWEWTESCRDDGHTRFVIIRGGSYFDASEGSIWYVRGGPQPCDSHAKFIRMWSGLDRCATIGFRCVVDAK